MNNRNSNVVKERKKKKNSSWNRKKMIVLFHFHRSEMARYILNNEHILSETDVSTAEIDARPLSGFFRRQSTHDSLLFRVGARSPSTFLPLYNFCVSLSFQRPWVTTHDVSSTRRRLLSQKSTAAKLNRQSSRARDVVLFSRPPRPLPPPAGRRCFERNVGERREFKVRNETKEIRRDRFGSSFEAFPRWKEASDED